MRVTAVMEAQTVTGPAKNLIRFAKFARERYAPAFEFSVVTYVRKSSGAPGTNAFIEAVRGAGIPLETIAEQGAFDRRVVPSLRKVLRAQRADIVQTHAVKSHFLMRFAKPAQVRWMAYHHGYTDPDLKMRLYNQLDRWSLPAADRVITVCQPFAQMLVKHGVTREKMRVLGNSIEELPQASAMSLEELRARWDIRENTRVVLAIGRLSKEKGHRFLVTAAHLLTKEQPQLDFRVLLLGDGHERERLQDQVRELGLDTVVRFTGHQARPLAFYSLADVFVLPSLSEGSPNVLLEAMMAGTPAVSTAVGGVPEIVEDDKSALLVPPADAAALARAIWRVLSEPGLATRLRENAASEVRTKHSPEAYAGGLMKVYRELV